MLGDRREAAKTINLQVVGLPEFAMSIKRRATDCKMPLPFCLR
jgi:hypothetical protein